MVAMYGKMASLMASTCALYALIAHADVTSNDWTLAETLFRKGRELVTAGRFAEACPKFAESQKLEPTLGTLLNLAACHEQERKLASAWVEFSEAKELASEQHQADREKFAREHMASIEPRLPKLTIQVAPSSVVDGLEIRLDDTLVGKPAWGTAMPVDFGVHRARATAKGRKTWEASVDVNTEAARHTMTVPKLEEESEARTPEAPGSGTPAGASATPAAAESSGTSSTHGSVTEGTTPAGMNPRTLVLAAEGALTVAGLVVGIAYQAKANSADTDVRDTQGWLDSSGFTSPCYAGRSSVPADCAKLAGALEDSNRARSLAAAGWVGAGVGAAALVTTWLIWKPTARRQAEAAIMPVFEPYAAGLQIVGRYR